MSESNEISTRLPIYPIAGEFQAKTGEKLNLCDFVRRVLEPFAEQISAQSISLCIDVPANLQFAMDGPLFKQALKCLCEEAVRNMPDGGELVITAVEQDQGIELEVADSRSDHLKSPRPFGGIGGRRDQTFPDNLHPVYQFAALHEGFVREQNCPEGGVAFTIHLPLNKAMRSAA